MGGLDPPIQPCFSLDHRLKAGDGGLKVDEEAKVLIIRSHNLPEAGRFERNADAYQRAHFSPFVR
jgi:hypothetical protein